jgi:hypothetical protein
MLYIYDICDKEHLDIQTVSLVLRLYITVIAITKVQYVLLAASSNVRDIQVFTFGYTE